MDPFLDSADPADPQSWNRYSYVGNNPLAFFDPQGRQKQRATEPNAFIRTKEEAKQFVRENIARDAFDQIFFGLLIDLTFPESKTDVLLAVAPFGKLGRLRNAKLIPTGIKDEAATALAGRLGGRASVKIEGFGDREFDAVSDLFVAQTTGAQSAVKNARNFLSQKKRAQIVETLKAAKATGRQALFEFRAGTPAAAVAKFIKEKAEEIGVAVQIQ